MQVSDHPHAEQEDRGPPIGQVALHPQILHRHRVDLEHLLSIRQEIGPQEHPHLPIQEQAPGSGTDFHCFSVIDDIRETGFD